MEKLCISVKELAAILGVCKRTAEKIAADKGFYPAFRIGTRVIISVDALREWINDQTKARRV